MVVIGEEYLLMNLLMDTLCLTAAMRLSSLRARPGRVLLAALAGALLSMIALSLWGLRASAYAALPIAVLMALLAFGLRRAPGGSARLLIAGLLSAGMAQYMHRLGLGGSAAALAIARGGARGRPPAVRARRRIAGRAGGQRQLPARSRHRIARGGGALSGHPRLSAARHALRAAKHAAARISADLRAHGQRQAADDVLSPAGAICARRPRMARGGRGCGGIALPARAARAAAAHAEFIKSIAEGDDIDD